MQKVVVYATDPFEGQIVGLGLGGLGLGVEVAASREELERLGREEEVVLVVMLGAGELLASAEGATPSVRPRRSKLYLLSWHHTASVAASLLEQGVDQCLTLPISISRLRRKVADLLQRSLPL